MFSLTWTFWFWELGLHRDSHCGLRAIWSIAFGSFWPVAVVAVSCAVHVWNEKNRVLSPPPHSLEQVLQVSQWLNLISSTAAVIYRSSVEKQKNRNLQTMEQCSCIMFVGLFWSRKTFVAVPLSDKLRAVWGALILATTRPLLAWTKWRVDLQPAQLKLSQSPNHPTFVSWKSSISQPNLWP